jgi:hypothetical protein
MFTNVHNAVCGSIVAMFLSALAIPEPALAGRIVMTVRPPTIVRPTHQLPLNPKPGGNSHLSLQTATTQSHNMQYLQLQNSMQNQNRQFTIVSNVMKTKHSTAKNSIRNIH